MRRTSVWLVVVLAAVTIAAAAQGPAPPVLDLVIRNGRLLDGAGNPWVRADIGIRGDRVVAVGDLAGRAATRVIDAKDHYVAPGFIDVHSHAGGEGLARAGLQQGQPLLAQGVTTIVANPDGGGPIDLAAQRAEFERLGLGVNVGLLIGHGQTRESVMGMADRPATPDELEKMRAIVRRAMDQGAFGLSSGLFYAPGSYAPTEEVIELMKVVAPFGGVHTSHIRDEGDYTIGVVASVDEIIRIAEATNTVGVVSHMKALGVNAWGLAVACATRIDRARARGVQVFADQYPYEASSTSLVGAVVPRWVQTGGTMEMQARLVDPVARARMLPEIRDNIARRGGPASLVVAFYGPERRYEGQSLAAIAAALQLPPDEAVVSLVARGDVSIVSFNMSEDDIEHIMRQPWTMTSSDGGLVAMGEGKPHPRNNGAHARKLARYVRDRRTVSLEAAVRSMTSLPALVFRMTDRGALRAGAFADVVIFDPATVKDTATYLNPHQLAEGVSATIVNGTVVYENGVFTDALPGRVLRRER
jgi:N-acyl-D-amino-acid deacylase